ncbi:MAG: hypothetical protein P8170_04945 [Gemmatimonadota bacterium]
MAARSGCRWGLASALTLAVLLAGCTDAGPQAGPGSVEVRVVSPNGSEGSALVSVFAEGIRSVSAVSGRVFSHQVADTVRVVVVADAPGDLRFAVSLADATAVVQGSVLQVADAEDRLRSTVADYALEFLR